MVHDIKRNHLRANINLGEGIQLIQMIHLPLKSERFTKNLIRTFRSNCLY